MESINVYFGGKLIRADGKAVVQDRLVSVVWREGSGSKDYFPYGDEIGTATAGNQDKFGTHHRDATSGLDYADQRYFSGLQGRFLASDPYEASGGPNEPGSWNRMAYVGGDPVNFRDTKGLRRAKISWEECWGPFDDYSCMEYTAYFNDTDPGAGLGGGGDDQPNFRRLGEVGRLQFSARR